MNATELAMELRILQDSIESLEEKAKQLKNRRDVIRNGLLPDRMQEDGLKNFAVENIGRVALYPVLQVRQLDKTVLFEMLRERGAGDLIQPTVNASSLKSYVTEQMEKGATFPEEAMSINAFLQARLTR